MTAETYVRARIDTRTKKRALVVLDAMGLSTSDAIRLLMVRIADEKRLPFEVKAPNRATIAAMAEGDAIIRARRARFADAGALFDELENDGAQ